MWRVANSAHWVAWGIVQANVKGMDDALKAQKRTKHPTNADEAPPPARVLGYDPLTPENETLALAAEDKRPESFGRTPNNSEKMPNQEGGKDENESEDEEAGFDYLGYAQDRAMFFWGDVLQLGLVQRDNLPPALLEKVKFVEY